MKNRTKLQQLNQWVKNSIPGSGLLKDPAFCYRSFLFSKSLRYLGLLILLIGISVHAFSQTNVWDGSKNNNWNEKANWSLNSVPAQDQDIHIRSNASISVNSNSTINSLTISNGANVVFTSSGGGRTITIDNSGSRIEAGSSLTLRGSTGPGTRSMTIAFSGTNRTMLIAGTLSLTAVGKGTFYNSTNSVTTVTGQVINDGSGGGTNGVITSTASNLVFGPASSYFHALNGGTVPAATWNATSSCNITGMTSTSPGGLAQTFGNLTLNSTGQTNNLVATGNIVVMGDFQLLSGTFALNNATGYSLTIAGDYRQTGGIFDFNIGDNTGQGYIYVGGDFSNLAGQSSMFTAGVGAPNGIVVFNGSGPQVLTIPTSRAAEWVKFEINAGSVVQLASNLTINSANATTQAAFTGEMTVNGTLDMGSYTISQAGGVTGVGEFTLNAGGRIITAHPNGIDGSVSSTNIQRSFSTGGHYTFNGTSAQITSSGLPATISSLTIFNTGSSGNNAVTLSSPTSVTGTLNLTSGVLTTSTTNLITVTNTANSAVTGGSTVAFVSGPLKWTLPPALTVNTQYVFPVGKGSAYLPFHLVNPQTGTGTVNATVEAFNQNPSGTYDASLSSISTTEYWKLITSGSFLQSSVSLFRQASISPLDVVGGSLTASGPYKSLDGTAGISGVTASAAITDNRFFILGEKKKQSITTVALSGSVFCAGTPLSVSFVASGNFATGNQFTAQLSNSLGSFSAPVAIGSVQQSTSGTINAILPAGTVAGASYRIRVVSDLPAITGTDNGSNFTINAIPVITGQPVNQTVTTGSGVAQFSVIATGAGLTFQWQEYRNSWVSISNGGVYSGATTNTLLITNPDIGMNGYRYRCVVTGTCSPSVTSDGNATLTVSALPTAQISGNFTICLGSSANLVITLTGLAPWSITYTDGVNPVSIGNILTSTYLINVSPTTNTTYSLTAVSDANGVGTYFTGSATVIVTHAGAWLGTTSSDWHTASNWCGGIPTSATDVIITAGVPNQPFIGTADAQCNNITLGSGAVLTIGSGFHLTASGDWINNGGVLTAGSGTVNFNGSGNHYMTGTSASHAFYSLGLLSNSLMVNVGADLTVNNVLQIDFGAILNLHGHQLSGVFSTTGSSGGTLQTGCVSPSPIPAGVIWSFAVSFLTSDQTIPAGIYNGSPGVQVNSGASCVLSGNVTLGDRLNIFNSTVDLNGYTITIGGTGTIDFEDAGAGKGYLNSNGGTVVYTGSDQTLWYDQTEVTFSNLKLGGSGVKTIPTGLTVIDQLLVMEGTAQVALQGTLLYNSTSQLQYNRSLPMQTGSEWITPFGATGGVRVSGSGLVSMNEDKILGSESPLTITSGSEFSTNNFQLTLGGDFNNAGSFSAGSSHVILYGNAPSQTIDGFVTTGGLTLQKGAGTATLNGDVSAGSLLLNGLGSVLSLGNGIALTVNGDSFFDAGSLSCGSSTLNLGGSVQKTNGNFLPGTGTVRLFGSTGQTIPELEFFNLTVDNASGVNAQGDLLIRGTLALDSGELSIGPNSMIIQNSDTPIVRVSGTLKTTENSNLTFGTSGNTGGNDFTFPSGCFSGDPKINNLTINRDQPIRLNDQVMNVHGVLLCNGPLFTNGNLVLVSSANKTALIDGSGTGNVSGNVTMQRYLINGSGYKFVSSPFKSSTVDEFADDLDLGSAFPSFYAYDEDNHSDSAGVTRYTTGWVKYLSGSMMPMAGYAANFGSNPESKVFDVTGEVNNDLSETITLYNHNRQYTKGFNLVGNPYPSPIDWDAGQGWTRDNIDDAVYFFDFGNSQYTGTYSSYINGVPSDEFTNSQIAAMQGFFVHVSDGDENSPGIGVLGMSNAVRINNLNPNFHKFSEIKSQSLIRLSARFDLEGSIADKTVVYFEQPATPAFNSEYDALKMLNTDEQVPNIFSLSSKNDWLSINGLPPEFESDLRIPLGMSTLKPGWVEIMSTDLVNLPPGLHVYLHDSKTGIFQVMSNGQRYRAYLPEGECLNRLWLVLSRTDLIAFPDNPNGFFAHSENEQLLVKLKLESDENALLSVCNPSGQVVWRLDVSGRAMDEIRQPLASGIYIVSLYRSTGIQSQKVYIPPRQ